MDGTSVRSSEMEEDNISLSELMAATNKTKKVIKGKNQRQNRK